MLTRVHVTDRARSSAVYSTSMIYRYALTREWSEGTRLLFVMLNPSTADERRNDPTVERCERRARSLGCGAMRVVNLFAYRATDPRDLKAAAAPVGPGNDDMLRRSAIWADLVLCAWGVHGAYQGRGAQVEILLRENSDRLCHLGLTRQGFPRHPLYTGYAAPLVEW